MQFFISDQVHIFLMSIICGAIMGIINEPFRFLRYMGINDKSSVFIQDIAFMIAIAFISFFFALCYNKGELRFFILLGELIGFLMFRYTIGLITGKLFYLLRFSVNKIIKLCKALCAMLSTILAKFSGRLLVKMPLLKNSKETPCKKGENYCIILKSVFRFAGVSKKR